MATIFLSKEISKLQKACKKDKAEMLRFFELITYLAASEEITLEEAVSYINILIKIKEEVKP